MKVNLIWAVIFVINITSCVQSVDNNKISKNRSSLLNIDKIQSESIGGINSNNIGLHLNKTIINTMDSNDVNLELIKDCEKCKVEYVKDLKLNLKAGITDTTLVLLFLCTIDKKCKNHVEFSQFSNAVLFLLLEKEPELTIDLLSKYEFQLDYLREMISQPINDGIDLNKIADGLLKVNKNIELRDSIINDLPRY